MVSTRYTRRPRDVDGIRSAAILYGDWGTSKAYVIGLAFALAGYHSFWLILGVCLLMALVAMNYMTICRYYPNGGGVYASVRGRSKVLSFIGAFFLIADYLVTAALSALASFEYLMFSYPEWWAACALIVIGTLNLLGPKHTGSLAVLIAIPTIAVSSVLAVLVIPHLGKAWEAVTFPPQNGFLLWQQFTGVIVALSGIEAIANTTGVMKLDPGSTFEKPAVTKTASFAILVVMLEVCLFTALFGLGVNGLPGLEIAGGEVNAPGFPGVRDAMLRYMGNVYGTSVGGVDFGSAFGWVVSLAFACLLLSAVNTSIVGLISILFILSRDREIPYLFQKVNRFGVPYLPVFLSIIIPVSLILAVPNVAGLADLYAVGFVGAIATNLGATSTHPKLPLKLLERSLMFFTFLIMAAIEMTLFIDKPDARSFALCILCFGLLLRSLVLEQKEKKRSAVRALPEAFDFPELRQLNEGATLCAISFPGRTLDFAIQECKQHQFPLYLLFIREQKVMTEEDLNRTWLDDKEACAIFDHIIDAVHENPISYCYAVSDFPAQTIVDFVKQKKVKRLILGANRKTSLYRFIRGNLVKEVGKRLSDDVDLIVFYGK